MLKQLMSGPPRRTLAVAESVTGGRLQALVTAESGASAFFLGGITAYNLVQKVRHLGVSQEAAAAVDCVSAEVAWEMARGACAAFGAELAVATTGYAEPWGPGGTRAPVVYWALCHRAPDGSEVRREGRIDPRCDAREVVQSETAAAVHAALLAYLADAGTGRPRPGVASIS